MSCNRSFSTLPQAGCGKRRDRAKRPLMAHQQESHVQAFLTSAKAIRFSDSAESRLSGHIRCKVHQLAASHSSLLLLPLLIPASAAPALPLFRSCVVPSFVSTFFSFSSYFPSPPPPAHHFCLVVVRHL
ncbi:unnamed protein product [Protopolystoma xenopodis]|uniref:Uncharacterized protein n=1 Tax=Protopolystoma xenopodis TaxID=117903 RepID=A0A3S5BWT6_9PLAT|nr:unnamed protein product [Protopolystoma xenopodis]